LPVRYLSYSILFAAVVGSQGIVKILDTHFAFARAKVPVLMMAILAVAGPNRLTYGIDLKHQSKVDLPVICYVHTTVKVNGQKVTP